MNHKKFLDKVFITGEDQFNDALESSYLILYLLVDWSGQERQSRQVVIKAVESIETNINLEIVDCSNQCMIDYLVNWFARQGTELRRLPYHGNGELLFIKSGKFRDVIRFPFTVGADEVNFIIQQWLEEV